MDMDERAIKRLLIMVGLSIIAIVVLKSVMLKFADKVGKAAVERKQAAKPVQPPPAAPESPTAAPASAVPAPDASAVPGVNTTQ